MGAVTNAFRTAYGLFYIAKFRPIVMVILNIIISVILVGPFGVAGVVAGTVISRMLTTAWLDPYIVYKYGFKESPRNYYFRYIYYLLIFTASSALIKLLTDYIVVNSILSWILVAVITIIIYHVIILVIFMRTDEFKYFYHKLLLVIKKLKKKLKHA